MVTVSLLHLGRSLESSLTLISQNISRPQALHSEVSTSPDQRPGALELQYRPVVGLLDQLRELLELVPQRLDLVGALGLGPDGHEGDLLLTELASTVIVAPIDLLGTLLEVEPLQQLGAALELLHQPDDGREGDLLAVVGDGGQGVGAGDGHANGGQLLDLGVMLGKHVSEGEGGLPAFLPARAATKTLGALGDHAFELLGAAQTTGDREALGLGHGVPPGV